MERKLENYEQVKDKALRLLAFRSHSEKELRDKLLRAGADINDIEKVLDFCRRYNFVNDLQYAKGKAKDLKNLKKYGRRRIEAELYAKGISSEYITEALLELDFDDTDTLMALVEKKLGGDFEKKSIDRCIRYFMYRGYDLSQIKECIDVLKSQSEE